VIYGIGNAGIMAIKVKQSIAQVGVLHKRKFGVNETAQLIFKA
jgi:hypothetical protein